MRIKEQETHLTLHEHDDDDYDDDDDDILKNRRASLDSRENWFSDSHNLLKGENELQPDLGEIRSKRSASNSAARLWV